MTLGAYRSTSQRGLDATPWNQGGREGGGGVVGCCNSPHKTASRAFLATFVTLPRNYELRTCISSMFVGSSGKRLEGPECLNVELKPFVRAWCQMPADTRISVLKSTTEVECL